MHGDFRPLIHPGTMSDEIDVEGTREYRRRVHERIRAHQLLERLATDEPAARLSELTEPAGANPPVETAHQIGFELQLWATRLLLRYAERAVSDP